MGDKAKMINTLLKATIIRRLIKLGIPPVQAMDYAQRMNEGDAVFLVRNHINFEPHIILTLIKNNIKK